MLTKMTRIAAIVVSTASLAGAANADLIAGWDFSQYRADGSLDDGGGPTDTLPANYSSLDATLGAGGTAPGDSADFGTMFMNGTLGSTDVAEAAAAPEVVPHAHDTQAGKAGPYTVSSTRVQPIRGFDAFSVLAAEGQANTQRLGLTARAPADIVFQADQGAVLNRTWLLSFAGFALDPTGNVDVDVEFAPSCGAYSLVQTVTLTADEQAFEIPLAANVVDDDACVRLSLDNANGQPVIDNVAVPEPGMAMSMIAGALALVGLGRRRRV